MMTSPRQREGDFSNKQPYGSGSQPRNKTENCRLPEHDAGYHLKDPQSNMLALEREHVLTAMK